MSNYKGVVELKSEDLGLELSGLVGRILAIQVSSNGVLSQIGQAWGFHLRMCSWPEPQHRGLCCKVEMDQQKLDEMKPQLLDGGIQLFVGDHQILWHVEP